MSRIGHQPIPFSDKTSVEIAGNHVTVTGPKGTLELDVPELISVEVADSQIRVSRPNDTRPAKAHHGATRSLLQNLVIGVEQGFKKDLEIQGVGYRAQVQGKTLTLSLGYSHPVEFPVPDGIEIAVNNNTQISVGGIDKQQVGQVAADIRAFRPPEVYKGKGIRYVGEYVLRKEGKKAV